MPVIPNMSWIPSNAAKEATKVAAAADDAAKVATPAPNTGRHKFAVAGAGIVAGLGGAYAMQELFPSMKAADRLERETGDGHLSSTRAQVYGMSTAMGVASGIAMGLARRTGTTGFTTATQISLTALTSTVAGAAINAGSDKATDYLAGIGCMGISIGLGSLAALRDGWAHVPVRGAGLLATGIGAGMLVPATAAALMKASGDAGRSVGRGNAPE